MANPTEADANNERSFVDQVMQPMKQAGEALKEARERATEQNEKVSVRLIDFAQSNMNDTLEALRAAAQAKDVSEALAVQSKFLSQQMTRSMDQFRELTELLKPPQPGR